MVMEELELEAIKGGWGESKGGGQALIHLERPPEFTNGFLCVALSFYIKRCSCRKLIRSICQTKINFSGFLYSHDPRIAIPLTEIKSIDSGRASQLGDNLGSCLVFLTAFGKVIYAFKLVNGIFAIIKCYELKEIYCKINFRSDSPQIGVPSVKEQ